MLGYLDDIIYTRLLLMENVFFYRCSPPFRSSDLGGDGVDDALLLHHSDVTDIDTTSQRPNTRGGTHSDVDTGRTHIVCEPNKTIDRLGLVVVWLTFLPSRVM